MIIKNEKVILLNPLKAEKLPIGPTTSIPGPILLSVVITEVNVVAGSKLLMEIIRTPAEKVNR